MIPHVWEHIQSLLPWILLFRSLLEYSSLCPLDSILSHSLGYSVYLPHSHVCLPHPLHHIKSCHQHTHVTPWRKHTHSLSLSLLLCPLFSTSTHCDFPSFLLSFKAKILEERTNTCCFIITHPFFSPKMNLLKSKWSCMSRPLMTWTPPRCCTWF